MTLVFHIFACFYRGGAGLDRTKIWGLSVIWSTSNSQR